MDNLSNKKMIGDLAKSMIVMLIGLPMATGLLYVLMVVFSHTPVFSINQLTIKYHESRP